MAVTAIPRFLPAHAAFVASLEQQGVRVDHPHEGTSVQAPRSMTGAEQVRALVAAAEAELGRDVPVVGTPYGSDMRNLVADAGIEAVTFGAGDVRGCHCPDEHLPVAELRQAATIVTRFALDMLLAP